MRSIGVFLLLPLLAALAQDKQDGGPAQDGSFIDRALARLWTDRGVAPAERSSDTDFLRRITLDLAGHIPTVDEVRAFLSSKDPARRTKKIDELLASDAFLDFWSTRLTNALLGYSRDFEYVTNRKGFLEWMRKQLEEDRGWDQIVSDVLTASGEPRKKPEVSFLAQFLDFADGQKYGLKIEELTGKISTAFLGIRLRCAQCHDHPFDKYTQEDFFGMVAFFQKTGPGAANARGLEGGGYAIKTHKQPLHYKFEHWDHELTPRFLDGPPPETENLRVEFTEVLTRHDQFARAFVNRVWAYLFGRGIVDPYDDFGPKHRAVAPELLEELVAQARANKCSARWLVRAIVTSEAYQRTSRATAGQDAKEQERLFARSMVRPLMPEQLWNAIERATDLQKADIDLRAIRRMIGADPAMQETSSYAMLRRWFLGMLVRTSNPDAPANLGQYSANVQQVLYAMNLYSPLWAGVRSKGSGRLDRLVLYQDDPDVILQELFLASLGRHPTDAERKRCFDHIPKRGGESKDEHLKKVERAYEVVFWAILNTDEFIFNH